MPRDPWTPARRHAMKVFATGYLCNDPVRRSNLSTMLGAWNGSDDLTCYWQTFDWMVAEGHAELSTAGTANGSTLADPWARLTPSGVELGRRLLPGLSW